MAEKHISIPKPFSSGDIGEWFQRFEICCKANSWDDAKKALKLPTLLEGEGLAVWLELSEEDQADYKVTKGKMVAKMAPMGFVSLDDFHKRSLHPGEALSVYLHALKKLLSQAMPNLEEGVRNQLLLHQLLSGLPASVSRQLRATGETTDLDKVMERARLLMTMEEQKHTAAVAEKETEVQHLRDQVTALTEQVAALSVQKRIIRCYECNQEGHTLRDCPNRRHFRGDRCRCFNCGRPGHFERECRFPPQRGYQGNSPGQGNENGAHVTAYRRPKY